MSFVSIQFLLLLLVTSMFYYLPIKLAEYQNFVLLIASISFVLLYDKAMIIVFVLAIIITYSAGLIIEKSKRKFLLAMFICADLFILLILKYSSFFAELPILCFIGKPFTGVIKKYSLFLPIGISFYTLALIGYMIDVYKGKIPGEKQIIKFTVFASFFPHILQGPIARYDEFEKQLRKYRIFDYERMVDAFQLALWGYIKKIIIADRAGIFVDAVYANNFTGDGTIVLVASLIYTVQIYADFSGCVDIALGIAKLLGIDLVRNFNVPYMSSSINEFWRRWHISLSSWFRDYIYIPLGGNRKGEIRRWINVLIVFLISGFWHGVGMNFIFWGLLHGVYQIMGIFWKPIRNKLNIKLTKWGGISKYLIFL